MRRFRNLVEVGLGACLGVTSGVMMYQRMSGEVRASNGDVGKGLEPPCEGLDCPVTKWEVDWDRLETFANSRSARHFLLVSPGPADDGTGELTTSGQQMAEKLAHRLAQLSLDVQKVVASPVPRQRSTAETISQKLGIPMEENPCLAPVIPANSLPPHLNDDHVLLRGSQVAEVAFRELFQRRIQPERGRSIPTTVEIYVTSANLIRFFTCRALQFPPEAWLRFSVSAGTISWITIHGNGTVEVRCVGEETGTYYSD